MNGQKGIAQPDAARKNRRVRYSVPVICLWGAALIAVCIASLCIGSVRVPLRQTAAVLANRLFGAPLGDVPDEIVSILLTVRAPRVVLAALVGASLSVAGAAMQGLIKNPLADGSTLGITSGASLGGVIAIGLGLTLPFAPGLSVALVSILCAFISLMLILSFAKRMDGNLSSNTIILTGVIFSMLSSSLSSLVITFAGNSLKDIVFWSLGSLSGKGWQYVWIELVFAVVGMMGLFAHARELDAFAMGEEQAQYSGVPVKRARIVILLCVSVLCGVSVSVCGNIAFVGLVIPHMVRMVSGPAHRVLMPQAAVVGAIFLVLCDLLSRVIMQPLELPIGVITSITGAIVFIVIFYRQRGRY